MNYIQRKLTSYLLRSHQKDILNIKKTLTKQEEDLLLSSLWQNQSFRNWIVARENALCLNMANELKKPSDEEYIALYGRRLEVMSLQQITKLAYNRRQKELEKKKV